MIDEASQAEAPTTGGGTLGLDETPAELWADVDRISQMNINLDLCLNVSGGGVTAVLVLARPSPMPTQMCAKIHGHNAATGDFITGGKDS